MFLLIEKLKISNFLSFFGENEINFKPFSTILCNFYEGKDDFFRAFEFVLGADLVDLRIDNPLDLVHKVFKEEFLVSHEIRTFVEVTVTLPREQKRHKFSRFVKFGTTLPRLEHKVSDIITSSVHYKEKLRSLNLYIKEKNSVFYKKYFNSVIWGSSEDLEMTISTCLRDNYVLEDWLRAKKEVEYSKRLKEKTAEKHYNSMKNSHFIIAKHAKLYETVLEQRESVKEEILRHLLTNGNLSSDDSSSVETDSKNGVSFEDFEENKKEVENLEMRIEALVKFLNVKKTEVLVKTVNTLFGNEQRKCWNKIIGTKITKKKHSLSILQIREAPLISCLHHEEIKLAAKPVNASVLQNRLSQIKLNIRGEENRLSEIWRKTQDLESEMETVSEEITKGLIFLKEIEEKKYLGNRLTSYGRLVDYLQPSRHVHLLKQIIGAEIFYANLCDSVEEAASLISFISNIKYEHREVFIPFENFSHKLKDLLIASGEKGIEINNFEELLIFLCKLKYFELIDEVPVIVKKKFKFEGSVSDNYIIYVQDNVCFTNDGLISYKFDGDDFCMETEKQLQKRVLQLQAQEELNFQKLNDLFFLKYETLVNISSLEKDYLYLKQNWKKSTQRSHPAMRSPQLPEIYEEYSEVFKQHSEDWQLRESELQQTEEPLLEEGDSSASSNEESLQYLTKELEDVAGEKIKINSQLELLTKDLYTLYSSLVTVQSHKYLIKFQNNIDKKKIFFEKEFKRLQRLMGEDDLLNFLGNQEWRKNLISSLIKDFEDVKTKLKISSEKLQDIATLRKRKFYPLIEHCGRYLSSTFNHLLHNALPFVELNFSPGEEKIHILSCLGKDKVNIVEIKHFNTFLKFACGLSIFLEISRFENIPVIVFDEFEEYFPNDDNFNAVMDSSTLEKLIPSNNDRKFHLLTRTGQFLKQFINKNSPGNHIRKNGSNKDYACGPFQIIYFTNGDLIHAAEHHVWIQNQVLPDEFITETCNSYSKIHELNFEENIN